MDSIPSCTRTSKLFCAPDADVSFLSSDGVLFKLHSAHLNTNSEVLATHEDTFVGIEAAPLPESASVLEILFQFIEPPPESRNYRQPLVHNMNPNLFFAVAEAAEKYIVYGATNTFITQMPYVHHPVPSSPGIMQFCDAQHPFRRMIYEHPFEVLNHCAKHAYFEIADDAAARSMKTQTPLNEAVLKLTAPGVLPRWLLYYDAWYKAAIQGSEIYEKHLSPNNVCHIKPQIYATYLLRIAGAPTDMGFLRQEVKNTVPCNIPDCTCHVLNINSDKGAGYPPWHREIDALPKAMIKFSLITFSQM